MLLFCFFNKLLHSVQNIRKKSLKINLEAERNQETDLAFIKLKKSNQNNFRLKLFHTPGEKIKNCTKLKFIEYVWI